MQSVGLLAIMLLITSLVPKAFIAATPGGLWIYLIESSNKSALNIANKHKPKILHYEKEIFNNKKSLNQKNCGFKTHVKVLLRYRVKSMRHV